MIARILLLAWLAISAIAGPVISITMPAASSGPWADANYDHYIAVTLPSSAVTSTETNFVASIDLDDFPDAFFADIQTDGDDIRVYADDDSTARNFVLESIDTTAKTGWLHVHLPTLSSTADTVLHVYFSYASAVAFANPQDTYDATGANYMGVWLMNTDATAAQASSTGVADIDADSFNMESGDLGTGKMGKAITFDGSNEYFSVPIADATANLRPDTSFTAGCWFKASDFTDGVLYQGSGSSTNQGYGTWIWGSQVRPSMGSGATPWNNITEPTSGLSTGVWYHVVQTWDGTNARFYLNGSEVADSPDAETGSWSWASQPFFFARRESAGYYAGALDHIFVHDDTFSANRITLLYQFQNSSFAYTLGTVVNQ